MFVNTTMTATPNAIVAKLVEVNGGINWENGLSQRWLHFAKQGWKVNIGGQRNNSSKMDIGQNVRNENDQRITFHCQWRGYITKNCLSKQCSNSPKDAYTAEEALTETTSSLTTLIKNNLMMASWNASASNWFINYRCKTTLSFGWLMFNRYAKYTANWTKVKASDEVKLFASGDGCFNMICHMPDGRTEMIMLSVVVHLLGTFNLHPQ